MTQRNIALELLEHAVTWSVPICGRNLTEDTEMPLGRFVDLCDAEASWGLSLALDVLGLPPDRTVEDGCENGYCRDWASALFEVLCVKHHDYERFIDAVLDKDPRYPAHDYDEIEQFFYGITSQAI